MGMAKVGVNKAGLDKLRGHSRQFAIYVCGGVLCALIDIGIMQLLLRQGVHLASATTAGFLAGLLVNYVFHSTVTFAAGATPVRFARYLCVVAVNYALTIACVTAAQALFQAPLLGKIASLPLVALSGYVLGKFWIFK
jgi:putative flippase GtrA